jgi:chromate transporter
MIYLQLLISYLKIGLFGFGGGYAMLSLIRHEVVEKNAWITGGEFTNIVAISQMTPGPIGINCATYIGYTVTGNIWGSIVATAAVCLPSFIIFLCIARAYARFRSNRYVESAFYVLRPATVGLIAAVVLLLMLTPPFAGAQLSAQEAANQYGARGTLALNPENFTGYGSILIFAAVFVLTKFLKIHPILLIILAGIVGIIAY